MATLAEIREGVARVTASSRRPGTTASASTTHSLSSAPGLPGADSGLLTEVIRVARASGWRGRFRRGNPARILKKPMSIVFSGTRVRGVAGVNWSDVVGRLSSCLLDGESFYLAGTYLKWTYTDGAARHPHDLGGYLCFSQTVSHAEIAHYRDESILARWLIGIVDGAYRAFNPLNFGNGEWHECEYCHAGYHQTANHSCNARRRIRGLPTTVKFATSLLVGCGVTGSWSLPVLSRVSGLMFVFDRDTVDLRNPNGRWPAARSRSRKITAAVEPCFRSVTMLSPRDFTWSVPLSPIDLAVLAPDSARARLQILNHSAITLDTWIVDLRVADGQLNAWCFKRGSRRAMTWRDDLVSYGNELNHCAHDNVSIVAGVMASAFLSWWATRDPLTEGIWTVPLNEPWENMVTEEREPESENETSDDYERDDEGVQPVPTPAPMPSPADASAGERFEVTANHLPEELRLAGEAEVCNVRQDRTGYFCTRLVGHAGDHVAHGTRGDSIWRWPQS